ncbi:uncharacterized protein LOC127259425 [Andrographis paniculata]|uniref:uncharacterized protein LOC127259425 n=1 Tax=Andrographis paniculata TaxID=175694 RepID=UPI0021E7EA23|nr:uncharacterized protein LOC127259425 [Andrographis paniculata]
MARKWMVLSVFMILFCTSKAENKTYPTANNNLSPIQAWRSAEYCLQNTSTKCWDKYTLTDSGWLNVTHEDGHWFCTEGCAEHTGWVLDCLFHVKKDYWFANKATLRDITDTINLGCNSTQGFSGVSIHVSQG